ncbi:RHS domain-containing protein [Methylomonas sp. UP202]|uniref:RHS domain-containing protein n=1 Tax=Methylomonas sp. UP202 TaxID=3040943 RepID=UPI00247B06C1|nr:RHS domain-containing protein [Methylomonas sp. UP202]WGS86534.1 RHS domain-containing protein [Methylomonas sp. UP202]
MALHEKDNTQASGSTYRYHLDHLGTPRELTNNQGHIVWSARYRAYGNLPGSRRSHRQPATYPRQGIATKKPVCWTRLRGWGFAGAADIRNRSVCIAPIADS